MHARERFVFFVYVFAPDPMRRGLAEAAATLPAHLLTTEHIDAQGDLVPPVLDRPMDAALEYVRHRCEGAPPPVWLGATFGPVGLDRHLEQG
jgi:hypothetical protein